VEAKHEEDEDSDASSECEDVFAQLDQDDAPQKASEKTTLKPAVPKKKLVPAMTPAAMAAKAKAAKEAQKPKVSAVQANREAVQAAKAEKQRLEKEAASGKPGALDGNADGAVVGDPRESPLPRGDVGTIWEALEDSLVREGKDIKSARCGGSVEAGECCEQTGPWRADPAGRVRMPINGPRKLVGWVTIDERRVQNALDKTYGKLHFAIADLENKFQGQHNGVAAGGTQKETSAPEEARPASSAYDDPFLDFLVDSQGKVEEVKEQEDEKTAIKDAISNAAAASGMSVRAYRRTLAGGGPTVASRPAPAVARYEKKQPEAAPVMEEEKQEEEEEEEEEEKKDEEAEAAEQTTVSCAAENGVTSAEVVAAAPKQAQKPAAQELTEAQKRLRTAQKKLRDLQALEEKVAAIGMARATPEQRAKLERGPELQSLVAQAEAEVAAEAKAAKRRKKTPAAAAEKKKKKKGSSCQEDDGRQGERSACSGTASVAAAVAIAALAAGAFYSM